MVSLSVDLYFFFVKEKYKKCSLSFLPTVFVNVYLQQN